MNIVVLGATGGIGAKLSLNLSEDNNLFLGSRDQQKFLNLKDEIKYNQINSKK